MSNKNYEIEALRGLAIISVIIGHLGNLVYWQPRLNPFLDQFSFGGGVDLFFTISGFVITKSFYIDLSQSSKNGPIPFFIEIKSFILRRMFRVMPAALAWILLICAFSIWFNKTGIFGNITGNFSDLVSIVFNYSNFHFVNCIKENFPAAKCGYNAIYWSMSLEEQFYLFFPLLVLLGQRWVVAITVGLLFFLTLHERTLLGWFTHPDGLLMGVCLAFASASKLYQEIAAKLFTGLKARLLMVGSLCVAILLMPHLGGVLKRIYPELTPLCCFLLVGLASFKMELAFTASPWRRALAYIGSRSFSLYLVHNPAAWIMRESTTRLGLLDDKGAPLHPVLFILTAFVLILFLAEVTYWLVETPWRRWGRQISAISNDAEASRDPSSTVSRQLATTSHGA